MEKQIEKNRKAKTSIEIMHHYAHNVFESEKVGDYWYEGNCLYCNSYLIAKQIDGFTIIEKNFNRVGAFGNGNNSNTIMSACQGVENRTPILYTKLRSLGDKLTDEDRLNIVLFNVNEAMSEIYDHYNRLNKLIIDKRLFIAYIRDEEDLIKTINDVIKLNCKLLNVDKKLVLNYIPNITVHTIVKYTNWSDTITSSSKIDKPISYYLKPSKWFNKKQRYELEFKLWKSKYWNTITLHNTTYREIYDDVEKRKEFEISCEQHKALEKQRKLLAQEEHSKKQLELQQELLDRWLSGEKIQTYLGALPVHLRLKDDIIETTKGANVPISHAKLLYAKFKECIINDKSWVYKGHSLHIGNYTVQEINKNDNGIWYIQAGCHYIKQEQIESFIKLNNLNW